MKKIAAATAILIALVAALFCFLPTFAENPGHRAQKPAADQQKAEEKSPPDTDPPRADEKCVYLTFDDGPTDSVTPKILDVLAREKVPATFFVIGQQIKNREKILQREADEGHAIGIHTYTHIYSQIYSSAEALTSDIEKCRQAIRAVLPTFDGKIYRFPGGSYGKQDLRDTVRALGYTYYDWNAATGDAEAHRSAAELFENAVLSSKEKRQVILLMHDGVGYASTIEALPQIIEYYRENGYTFRTL